MSQQQAGEHADQPTGPTHLSVSPESGACSSCGQPQPRHTSIPSSYIYAIGKIEPRFPRQSIEKEFAQVVGRSNTKGLTDRQTLQRVLSQRENRYLARQICWVLMIEGLETYLLVSHDPADLDLLLESLPTTPSPMDIDVVIGMRGSIAPPDMCNGLTVPMVLVDQIYSFDHQSLLNAMPKPKESDPELFKQASAELLERVMQLADNNGAADAHRALNYLAVRYPAVYAKVADAFVHNYSLAAVDVIQSRLTGARKIVDVILSFVNRGTDVTEKCFVRVDVTDEFPFLITKLSPYYDR
jgi:hypothetical protein